MGSSLGDCTKKSMLANCGIICVDVCTSRYGSRGSGGVRRIFSLLEDIKTLGAGVGIILAEGRNVPTQIKTIVINPSPTRVL